MRGLLHNISSASVIPIVSPTHDSMALLTLHMECVLAHLNYVADFVKSDATVVVLSKLQVDAVAEAAHNVFFTEVDQPKRS